VSKGLESVRSIGEVLEAPDTEQNEGKEVVAAVRGAFRFEGVSFHYPETDTDAINDLNLTVEPGESIGLVGHSGAGKSTVIHLVIGFIRPTAGRILLDGHPMEGLDLRTYRRFLSVVPQETVLFEGTVCENVTYGLGDVPIATVRRALEDANALEFVEQMDNGLETRIGERGTRLSGGQKQRLAIARALIRNPRVLLLDEATSALDSDSEALIQSALERLMRGRTTFVVAHRLSTIRSATRIVVLDGGRVVETGPHAELLASDGLYSRLLARQLR
jgi:ATP-binding cassette subfamily B protein